ncbi:fatty acyl-CoA reductase wat-like [Harmonia axyridis]|uniref:fatty acyl-CoA reductase wat-like n=1 Tax=Harmonia axyridis TaxID=115357 RepID=UPI001E27572C|nr:fatty acyl-CoA reductase wat-like [Harmonia axyridis]
MSLIRNEIEYPPRTYKTVKQLALPENKNISIADIDSITKIHEKVHASVEGSKIVEFYNGKSIFLTGGTGFIGKLMTEKLLRTCTGIETLYLLVRPKRGKNAESRLDDTFDDEIFSELWKAQPKFRHKVVPIQGDITLPSLGMSNEDRNKLIQNVNVIIHGAACVRFDEPLKRAATVHIFGTKEIMTLAQQCKNLVSLVHISTAYSQCAHKEIKEELYDPVYLTEPFLKMIETNSEKYLEKHQDTILRGWPNTYSFTKALAEYTVQSMANNIPAAICRPGIVTSTYKEPLRSWIDNLYGPMGAIVGAGTGIMRTFHLDEEKIADLIPGDFVANGVIAAGYQNQFNEKGVIKVYNNISSAQNPITWGDFTNLAVYYGLQNPTVKSIWYYCNTLNKNRYIHFLFEFFLHLIPALLIDGYLLLVGRKRRMVNIYKKIHKFSLLLSYFSLREWKMHNENLQKLWNNLSDKDKEIFEFSMAPEDFNWNSYISILGGGVRLYLLKDKMETIPAAKRKYRRLYYLHNAFKGVCLLIALKLLMSVVNIAMSIFSSS